MRGEWTKPQTMLRLSHEKFGPLEVISEQRRAEPSTRRLKIVSPDKPENPHASVTYWPHETAKDIIYVYKADTTEECRKHGMAGALLTLLSALEQKKLFLIPTQLGEKKRVYQKIGFKRDHILEGNDKIRGLSLENAGQLIPQKWATRAVRKWNATHPDGQPQKAVRKFYVKKDPSDK